MDYQGGVSNLGLIFLIVLVILLGVVLFFWFGRQTLLPVAGNISGSAKSMELTPTKANSDVLNGKWVTYQSPLYDLSIQGPEIVTPRQLCDKSVSFLLNGPSQTAGSQFVDGLNVRFYSGSLGKLSLYQFVKNKISVVRRDRTVNNISLPQSTMINGMAGLEFKTTGLSTVTYYFLQRNKSQYIEIIDESQDPNNRGYITAANRIITSMQTQEMAKL